MTEESLIAMLPEKVLARRFIGTFFIVALLLSSAGTIVLMYDEMRSRPPVKTPISYGDVGIFAINKHGDVIYWSEEAEKLTGISDVKRVEQIIPKSKVDGFRHDMEFENKHGDHVAMMIVNQDGKHFRAIVNLRRPCGDQYWGFITY